MTRLVTALAALTLAGCASLDGGLPLHDNRLAVPITPGGTAAVQIWVTDRFGVALKLHRKDSEALQTLLEQRQALAAFLAVEDDRRRRDATPPARAASAAR